MACYQDQEESIAVESFVQQCGVRQRVVGSEVALLGVEGATVGWVPFEVTPVRQNRSQVVADLLHDYRPPSKYEMWRPRFEITAESAVEDIAWALESVYFNMCVGVRARPTCR